MQNLFRNIFIKGHVWIVLAIIILFGGAAFYSCIEILQKEEHAISSYKEKVSKKQHLDNVFQNLKSKVILYFDQDRRQINDLEEIAQCFSELQNAFIFFNQDNKFDTSYNAEEMVLVETIQENIIQLIPYIQNASSGELTELPMNVLEITNQIQMDLNAFGEYQIQAENRFLSDTVLKERRQRIFTSVSLLGLSSLCLILFLFYKNKELERVNRQKEEFIKTSDQLVRAIEASSDGIAIMDSERKLIYMNKALHELHGITDEDAKGYLGQDWKELYNDKGKAHIEGNIYPMLFQLGEWRGESRVMRKDGQVIEAELSLSLLPDDKGFIGTARDITHRRRAEKENRDLQNQIHQAQKMEAIGRLAGGVAHDFNNVLAAIMGYAEFLSEDLEKDKKLKDYADNILMAGQKGRALVDQMLTFSRRKENTISVVDLKSSIHEASSMMSAGLPKSINLNVNIHHEKPAYINGDVSQITQAIMNIVVNAVDAMEDEKGELDISLSLIEPDEEMFEGMVVDDFLSNEQILPTRIENVEAGHAILEMGKLKRHQNYYQISISDTGTGISEAILEHIFEPFFTTKSVEKGTGLGMANVHGAITAHRGAMIIDSVLMEGTTFDLFFPQAEYINDLALLGDNDEQTRLADFADIRILIIDDQPEVLNMMETLLTREGFECMSKSSPLDALDYLREAHDALDIVITDQNMPNMTGVELAAQTEQLNSKLPFIIISGYSHEKLQELKQSYPSVKATIRKPAKKDHLLNAIDKVLKETLV